MDVLGLFSTVYCCGCCFYHCIEEFCALCCRCGEAICCRYQCVDEGLVANYCTVAKALFAGVLYTLNCCLENICKALEVYFVLTKGGLTCNLSSIEVMGRDVSIVSTHEACAAPAIRSIVDADYKIPVASTTVRYELKPHKVFLFDYETEERIYFEV